MPERDLGGNARADEVASVIKQAESILSAKPVDLVRRELPLEREVVFNIATFLEREEEVNILFANTSNALAYYMDSIDHGVAGRFQEAKREIIEQDKSGVVSEKVSINLDPDEFNRAVEMLNDYKVSACGGFDKVQESIRMNRALEILDSSWKIADGQYLNTLDSKNDLFSRSVFKKAIKWLKKDK